MVPVIFIVEVISRLVSFMSSWPLLSFLVGVGLNVLMGFLFLTDFPIQDNHTHFCSLNYLMKHNIVYKILNFL